MIKRSTRSSTNKKVKNTKPKTYNGISFKSSLEAYAYRRLSEEGFPVFYEKVKIELIPKFTATCPSVEFGETRKKGQPVEKWFREVALDNRNASYKPDFTDAESLDEITWLMETKGMKSEAFDLRWKITKYILQQQGRNILMLMPNNQKQVEECILRLKEYTSNKQVA